MAVFDATLYVGAQNSTTRAKVWRSSDSITWQQANADGFGEANHLVAQSMAVFSNYLYAGTNNLTTGAKVWRISGVAPPQWYLPLILRWHPSERAWRAA